MRFAFLALIAGLLSCQTATQITVELHGVGVACPSGDSPTIEQTGVLAKRQLQSRADLPELGVVGEECKASSDSQVSLGNIVLVPAEGPGPVEVLAVGALKVGDAPAVSAEDCRAEYERLFGSPCEIGEGHACESCIFARRSVAFVKHSKLEITIDLDATCAGVICDPSQTCSKGRCVSAEASCAENGSCTLVNENDGGAGAGGNGGGPTGGQGGQGGGGNDGPWFPMWEPGDPGCAGVSPSDVIGAAIDLGTGIRFHALVPAGPCMLVLEDGETPLAVSAPGSSSSDAYRAVARANATNNFVSFGDLGFASFNEDPPFGSIGSPLGGFDPSKTGVTWDIAPYDTLSNLGWTRTYQDETGVSGEIVPFVVGQQDSIKFAGLFGVFPIGAPSQPVTFGAWDSSIAARRAGLTNTLQVAAPDGGWFLWADELTDDPGTFQLAAFGGTTDRVYVGRCTNTSGPAQPNCDFASTGLNVLPSSIGARKVAAIWGLQTTTGIDIYAVGNNGGGQPWLARAALPDPADLSPNLAWAFAPLPDVMQVDDGTVSSVWVGHTDNATDSIVVVGPTGVFKAALDDLDFLFVRP